MSVTVRRAATRTDRYGATVPDWDDTTDTVVAGAVVAPLSGSESTEGGREGVPVDVAVYLPPGVDVVGTDRLVIDAAEYLIDGHPAVWVSPYTGPRGVVVTARRMEG